MRPSVVTDTVGLETLTEVLAKVSYAICSAPCTYYAALAAYCQAFYVDCYEAMGTIMQLPQPRTSSPNKTTSTRNPFAAIMSPASSKTEDAYRLYPEVAEGHWRTL